MPAYVLVPSSPKMAPRDNVVDDDTQLQSMGIKPDLKRNFSSLSMLGLAFAILNSWTALAASLSLALPSGGPVAVIWGLVTAGICNLCLAASLAEFLSAYPTAGGQYHWVAVISPRSWAPILSWITGWINVAGWIALVATGGLLSSQLVLGVISLFHEEYEPQPWHQFLIYIVVTFTAFLVNTFGTRVLPHVTKSALIWTVSGFTIIGITLLACSSPNYNSGDLVFRLFINNTGWPEGLAWLLGLLQGSLGLTGFDAVAHMIEEIPNPTREGPKIMVTCVAMGLGTGLVFLIILLFVAGPLDPVVESAAGPVLQIFYNATQNRAGAICLLIFPLVNLLFATISIMTTSSRMTFAFARDGGLPFSRFFAKVHPSLDLPLNSLYLTTGLVIIFGCIFLGSSVALNAIVSASVVALGISYAIPPAVNCLQGRTKLPDSRPFKLPNWFGWTANIIGISYALLTTVLFLFPPALPVDAGSMNYCIVAFGIVIIISTTQWYVDGRKNYNGPQIDIEVLQEGGALATTLDSHETGASMMLDKEKMAKGD